LEVLSEVLNKSKVIVIRNSIKLRQLVPLVALVITTSCGTGGKGAPPKPAPTPPKEIFPTGLIVQSPFEILLEESAIGRNLIDNIPSYRSGYDLSIALITDELIGNRPPRHALLGRPFLEIPLHASCFGPNLNYENHPQGSGPNSGSIPNDELGIWQEIDTVTGFACAAEELNSQLGPERKRNLTMYTIMAAMVNVINTNGLDLPEAGSSIEIMHEMNSSISAFSDTNLHFNSAVLTHTDEGNWVYQLNYDIAYNWPSGVFTHNFITTLEHTPGTENPSEQYEGSFSYQMTAAAGNTNLPGTTCPNSLERTLNGSTKYVRESASQIRLQHRVATFCGANIDGHINSDNADNGMVDDDLPYDGSNSGWSQNFGIFVADFDPSSLAGKYSYVWQDSPDETYSHVFNFGVFENNNKLEGEAYYGYGDPINTTDGRIKNFVCNRSAPNGGLSLTDRTYLDRVQRQHMTLDSSAALFLPTSSDASNILYAPTNDCDYDGSAPNGEFIYDTNGDGSLADETHHPVTNELWKGDGTFALPDLVTMQGFMPTNPPGGWPSEN